MLMCRRTDRACGGHGFPETVRCFTQANGVPFEADRACLSYWPLTRYVGSGFANPYNIVLLRSTCLSSDCVHIYPLSIRDRMRIPMSDYFSFF